MTKPPIGCDEYLQDPETHPDHLESCRSCRAIADELGGEITLQNRTISLDELPLAPWEGAAHRTWPLVLAGAAAILILAIVLFLAAGTSPLQGIVKSLVSVIPSLGLLVNLSELAGGALHKAPAAWHVAIGISFVVINTILFLLLRRAPRGIDA